MSQIWLDLVSDFCESNNDRHVKIISLHDQTVEINVVLSVHLNWELLRHQVLTIIQKWEVVVIALNAFASDRNFRNILKKKTKNANNHYIGREAWVWQGRFFFMLGPFIVKIITQKNYIAIMLATKKNSRRNIQNFTLSSRLAKELMPATQYICNQHDFKIDYQLSF